MIRTWTAAALVAFAVAGRAEASPESAAAAARTSFDLSILSPRPEFKRSITSTWQSMAAAAPAASGFFRISGAVLATTESNPAAAAAAAPALEIDLAGLLNKQLKTSLKFNVGGKDVWVGGAFDRAQNANVSILVDGGAAQFYDVRKLLDKEQPLELGTARYKMYLAPNIINQMKSEIILENVADEDDMVRITLKKMLEGVGATGAPVTAGGKEYKVFYTDDIKAGRVDKTAKTITFIHTEAKGEIHVFLIPAELVPSDKIAVFKMFANARVGLSQKDGKLKVYENP
jgi:hypothetical protein